MNSYSKISKPIRVYIKDFSYTANTATTFYLFVENPVINSDMRLRIKAVEGSNYYSL